MGRLRPARSAGRVQFYDVIPASWLKQHPMAGTLARRDIREGMRIRITGADIGGAKEVLATITGAPVKSKHDDYRVELVLDAHFSKEHPDRRNGHYTKCCYEVMSLREMGVIPQHDGSWDTSRYTTIAPRD